MELISFHVCLHKINNINNRIMKTKLKKELIPLLPIEVKEMKLPPKANEIYCQFFSMANEDGWYYSTIEGLANELNCSKSTVIANLKLLEIKKLIIERVLGKKGVASRFRIKLFNSTNNSTECNNHTESYNDSTNNSTESYNDSTNNSTECNNHTESYNDSTNNSTEFSTELKTFIEEVIALKMNELKNDIILELRRLFNNGTNNNDTKDFLNDSTLIENNIIENKIKENKLKEYNIKQTNNNNSYTNSSDNIQEVNNTDIDNNLNIIENIDINKKENIEIDKKEDIDKSTCKYKKRKQNDYQFTVEEKDDYNPIVENTKVEGIGIKSDCNTKKTKKIFYSLKGCTSTFSYSEALEYVSKNNLNFDECFKKVEVTD